VGIMAEIKYLDFELEIGSGAGREYPVAVLNSPAGEARETMRFPFDELALQNRLKDLQIALLRSGGKRRRKSSAEERAAQEFGQALFEALIAGEIRSRYDLSQREAEQKSMGLRLKLRIQPPELAALPWEYLYDSREAEFVCLSRSTPIIRYLELPRSVQPLIVTPPLHILMMTASPSCWPQLEVSNEKQRVETATKHLQKSGLMKLTWLQGQTWRDLQRAMQSGPWHIFHFIGHGEFDHSTDEGVIILADEDGQPHRLNATQLGRLLADHFSLRLVLLNSCEGAKGSEQDLFSSTAAILVRRGVPAVLAMQYEITDRAAIEFSRSFYETLTIGMPVDAAVAEARKAISCAVVNTVEWGTPVLYMRSPDGKIFDLAKVDDDEKKKPRQQNKRQIAKASSRKKSKKIGKSKPASTVQSPADMVYIPAGIFLMGSEDGDDDVKPEHEVYVEAFFMDRHEVTVAQYQRFISAVGYDSPDYWDEQLQYPNRPVVCVSWNDANAYTKWALKRLPTEAEWEYAARGGYTGVDGKTKYKYPWGNEIETDKANFNADGSRGWGWENAWRFLQEVGSYSSNGYGLYDMAGNVWEWCADWYEGNYYKVSSSRNPQGPASGEEKVLRGGSWGDYSRGLGCAYRGGSVPTNRVGHLGFRCAQDAR